jgi:hypothetical protein
VDARFFAPNIDALAEKFHLYTPERRGHGHTPDVDGPITDRQRPRPSVSEIFTRAIARGDVAHDIDPISRSKRLSVRFIRESWLHKSLWTRSSSRD